MENIDKKAINKKTIALAIIIIVVISLGLSFINNGDNGGVERVPIIKSREYTTKGLTVEGESWGREFDFQNLTEIYFELGWTDDEGAESEPDTFEFSVFADGINEVGQATNEMGGYAFISFTFSCNDTTDEFLPAKWGVSIRCIEAGDTPGGPLGLWVYNDPGNVWHMYISYKYIEYEEEGEYTVTATVMDDDDAIGTAETTIKI